MNLNFSARRGLLAFCAILAVGTHAARAQDTKTAQANALYADVPADLRSDAELWPALATLQPPPAAVRTLERAMLLPAQGAGWSEVVTWVEAQPQRTALAALSKAAKPGAGGRTRYIAQGYGLEGVSPELIAAGLYTELGDPPTLAAAKFLYMPALDTLAIAANVEATRLAAQGKPAEAMDVLIDLFLLGRQMADRQFLREAMWGHTAMALAMQRLRDVAYGDFRGQRLLTGAQVKAAIARLDDTSGIFFDRIRFPKADYLAGQQVVERVFSPSGAPDERIFGRTLARVGSAEHPLQSFSAAAAARRSAANHKDAAETKRQLERTYTDFQVRWTLDWFDRRMLAPYEYSRMDTQIYGVIPAVLGDFAPLFDARQIARTELVGTRAALAVAGFYGEQKIFPPTLASVRPAWIKALEADPYNPRGLDRGGVPPMEYFVPIRDTRSRVAPRSEPQPHEINIVTTRGANFTVKLRDDQFVVYSVGADNQKNWAERVQNTPQKVPGADYLIWPSELALVRERLLETGQLK